MLHLSFFVHSEEELEHLEILQSQGVLTLGSTVLDNAHASRHLQGTDWSTASLESNFTCYRTVEQTFASVDMLVEDTACLIWKS